MTGRPEWLARDWETVEVDREGWVAQVRLARPDRLNALSVRMRAELADLWQLLAADVAVRTVVVTGSGRAFSAGADSRDLDVAADRTPGAPRTDFLPGPVLEVPVVLAVNGLCLGGALRFVADADVVVADEGAWFSDPHVSLGLTSGPCAVQLAARSTSAQVAPLVLAGAGYRVDAHRAREMGLVSEVVPAGNAVERAHELAAMIAAQSPSAVRHTLALLRRRARDQVADLVEDAWDVMDSLWDHPDVAEGRRARAESREPRWADPEPTATHDEEQP